VVKKKTFKDVMLSNFDIQISLKLENKHNI